jgi:hypothetical protein
LRFKVARPLSEAELGVLNALLAHDFSGVEQLRAQLPHVQVVGKCDCGCPTVELRVPEGIAASPVTTDSRLAPVEGNVRPAVDGPPGNIILFVDDGRMTSLEYVSYADPPPKEWPPLGRITITRTR